MNKILIEYNNGLSNTQIAKKVNCSISNVTLTLKRNGIKNKHQKKYTYENFMTLYEQGFNDIQIAKKLNISSSAIQEHRKSLNLDAHYRGRNTPISPLQKEVLIGTILGDTYLQKQSFTTSGMFAHSMKQELYFKYKYSLLENLMLGFSYKQQLRNDTMCYSITANFKSIIALNEYHDSFYTNRVKDLPNEKFIFDNFTELSFAIWYGDDGFLSSTNGYSLATNSFPYEKQIFLQKLLLDKLNIKSNVVGKAINDYKLYIPSSEKEKVVNILKKYLKNVLDYKICRSYQK